MTNATAADIAGLIAQPGKLSLWLGGGMNYAAGFYSCYVVNGVSNCGTHDAQPVAQLAINNTA